MKIREFLLHDSNDLKQPFSPLIVQRILILLVVLLSLAAGYFHSAWKLENQKYLRLEDNYVRVRDILGREETQRLIDLSQKLEDTTNQSN